MARGILEFTVGQLAQQDGLNQVLVAQAQHEQALRSHDKQIGARHVAVHRASEFSLRVEPNDLLLIQEIIVRIAIYQRADRDHHQAFFAIGHENPRVNQADILFFVVCVYL